MRDDESTYDVGLATRPAPDQRSRAVAKTNIARTLFAVAVPVEIGRYHLLQRVGAGGMGVVWGAWDPELERRVAIKLVKVAAADARAQILREGQALAKLSHPHVVPIYDVGSVANEVYLVMEWVAGATLRAWVTPPRTTRDIVARYRAAGEGLAAAHAAGIVHRDFKPENVIVGDDGRVRVLDFGLARFEATGDGRGAGTPRYRAPEQTAGAPATPAADQYSFCVSLKEALGDPPPGWLAAIIARGTSTDPAARFPDMAAVLVALARDPARIWRRRAALTGVAVLAGAAFGVGTARGHAIEPCAADTDELAGVWSPTIAVQLSEHARTLGPYGALEAPTLADHLGRYTERWAAARKSACIAHQREEVPAAIYARTLACLERARGALDATVAAASRASLDRFAEAVLAVEALPDAGHCALTATTDAVAGPTRAQAPIVAALGADAAKAQYLALAADPAALPLARSVVAAATALGYKPLEARANLALGSALQNSSVTSALPVYATSAHEALTAGDDPAFVEAFSRELFVAGRTGAAAPLVAQLPIVVTIAIRGGDSTRFARALLYNNAGTERLAAGDVRGAVPWFERASAEAPNDRAAELWASTGNLAMTVDDTTKRDRLFAEERHRLDDTLGPQHAFALQERLRAAMFVDDPETAATELREICAALTAYHPERVDNVAACHYELGWLALAGRRRDEATRAFGVVAAGPAEHAPVARAALELLAGAPAAARSDADTVARRAAAETAWWKRFAAVDAWIVAAEADRELGRDPRPALRSALQVFDTPGFNTTAPYYQHRLARVRELLTDAGG